MPDNSVLAQLHVYENHKLNKSQLLSTIKAYEHPSHMMLEHLAPGGKYEHWLDSLYEKYCLRKYCVLQ